MADSTIPFIQAAQVALSGVCGGRVYGEVPKKVTYPYAALSCSSEPFDTADTVGMDHTLRVQIFSRAGKPGEALAERQKAYNALHRQEAAVSVAGFNVVHLMCTLADYFKEDDGETWQAVIEFSARVD